MVVMKLQRNGSLHTLLWLNNSLDPNILIQLLHDVEVF
jgi:hypothetical protein